MRSGNPALTASTFDSFRSLPADPAGVMTLQGTVHKSVLLLLIVFAAGAFTWMQTAANPAAAMPWVIGGALTGLVLALVTVFKKHWSPITAPLYALAEGLFVGAISARYNAVFDGIVLQAVLLTLGVFCALLGAYTFRLIKATENFRLGVFAATAGILLVYLLTWVLGFFGIQIPYIHGSGPVGIGFSVFVVIIAALNLVLDFDFIEQGSESGAPKYMEWYASFGLLVTLIWLYLEILRLLAKIASRRE